MSRNAHRPRRDRRPVEVDEHADPWDEWRLDDYRRRLERGHLEDYCRGCGSYEHVDPTRLCGQCGGAP